MSTPLESYRRQVELARIRWDLARADFEHALKMSYDGRAPEGLDTQLRETRAALETAMGLYESMGRDV